MEKLLENINEMLKDNDISYILKGMLISLKEELGIQLLSIANNNINYKKAIELSKTIKNIQLGCGKNLLDNYINIDILSNADVNWDIRNNLPFKDETIKKIFSEHVFEHMDFPVSANNLLAEMYRILEKDGELILGVPDCGYPLNDILKNSTKNMEIAKQKWYKNRPDVIYNMNTNLDYLNYVMRDQLFHDEFHPHYWGYNEENLTLLLKKHKFKDIKIWKPDSNIINPKREWGTLYLIAQK